MMTVKQLVLQAVGRGSILSPGTNETRSFAQQENSFRSARGGPAFFEQTYWHDVSDASPIDTLPGQRY
jgi:hypothetical protein